MVEPITASGNNLSRNVRRRVSSNVARATASGNGGLGHSMGDFLSLIDLLNMNTRTLIQRPFREIKTDYQQSVANLEKGRAEGDEHHERFDKLAVCNLFEELQKCSC
jgi:hypothetical protein